MQFIVTSTAPNQPNPTGTPHLRNADSTERPPIPVVIIVIIVVVIVIVILVVAAVVAILIFWRHYQNKKTAGNICVLC